MSNHINISVRDTFAINCPAEATVPAFPAPSEDQRLGLPIPEVDPNYLFQPDSLRDILAFHQLKTFGDFKDSFMFFGAKGAGKTSLIDQVAARLNIPTISIIGHSRLETPELFGKQTLLDGDLMFQDGPLTTAMRRGWWFVLSEYDMLDPGTQVGLNDIAEGRPLVLEDNCGEIVRPAPGFAFLITGNTNGGGDATGTFHGALLQNSAFLDRFISCEVSYPILEAENKILAGAVPSLPEKIRKNMIEVANEIRKLHTGDENTPGQIDITCSTRALIRWAKLLLFFKGVPSPAVYSMHRAFGNTAEPAVKIMLEEIVQRIFGAPVSN